MILIILNALGSLFIALIICSIFITQAREDDEKRFGSEIADKNMKLSYYIFVPIVTIIIFGILIGAK